MLRHLRIMQYLKGDNKYKEGRIDGHIGTKKGRELLAQLEAEMEMAEAFERLSLEQQEQREQVPSDNNDLFNFLDGNSDDNKSDIERDDELDDELDDQSDDKLTDEEDIFSTIDSEKEFDNNSPLRSTHFTTPRPPTPEPLTPFGSCPINYTTPKPPIPEPLTPFTSGPVDSRPINYITPKPPTPEPLTPFTSGPIDYTKLIPPTSETTSLVLPTLSIKPAGKQIRKVKYPVVQTAASLRSKRLRSKNKKICW